MASNSRTVALLTPDADVVWMCHPQADSAAVFSRLLGDATTGHFAIGPRREALPLIQRYVTGTLTVETRWASLLVTDYLSHDVGARRTDLIRVISGQAKAMVEFAPRPEFAQAPVHLRVDEGGLRVFATNDPMVLRSPGVEWEIVPDGSTRPRGPLSTRPTVRACWSYGAVQRIWRRVRWTRTRGANARRAAGATGSQP
jgi:trehalose 6-phosphate phosphatase